MPDEKVVDGILPVAALLITGRASAVKTSMAKAVALRVQADQRVQAHTLYVDLV
ncbi:hypothetical protein FIBSPDRAFT_966366 [Athelia psychrophila]|uniref:Uncharacterized protein n=1 Tax=Athelia psychrophila TaxID=1759441 RepID=A0A167WVE2_9AGAM|nr:hypothetical protein FIBSPDRAFT_966366 [Fibularhizoctonia sp. CBS 109695]